MFAVLILVSGAVAFGEPVEDVMIKAGETVKATGSLSRKCSGMTVPLKGT